MCPVRDVMNQTFTADWELVGNDRMSRMIAHTSHHLISSKRAGEQEVKKNEETQTAEEIQQPTATASTEAFLAVAKPSKRSAFSKLGSLFQSGLKKSQRSLLKRLQPIWKTTQTTSWNTFKTSKKASKN